MTKYSTTEWVEDSKGLMNEGQGPFSPEELATDAWSRRFVLALPDGTFKVLTYYAAGVWTDMYDEESHSGETPCDVRTCTEVTVCTDPADPGSTELDTDYEWEFVNYVALSVEDAEAEAIREVKGMRTDYLTIAKEAN